MNPKFFAAGLLVSGVLAAAGGGAYLAVRQNAQAEPVHPVAASPATAPTAARPVTETEAVVGTPKDSKLPAEAVPPAREQPPASVRSQSASSRTAEAAVRPDARRKPAPAARPAARTTPAPSAPSPAAAAPPAASPASERPAIERETVAPPPVTEPIAEPAKPAEPPPPALPQFDEVVIPASAVIGLQVETALSTERSKVEDRVDARVTRDVTAGGGRVAIPQGSRVIGSVTFVDKGGKVKSPARLGVRFHTLVLADGREIPLRTEPFFRDGESPAGDSTRKIGGAAVGGAILGAIIGGGKGAAIGGAAGAAGGTAAVMAGDRNAAVLAAGTIVTVRLSAPVTVEVEKRN